VGHNLTPRQRFAVLWRKRHKTFLRAALPLPDKGERNAQTNKRPLRQTRDTERLHAELGGKILDNRQEAERLGEQMMHVEAVIKMLDPAYNLASPVSP
jgi:hypothetical protein